MKKILSILALLTIISLSEVKAQMYVDGSYNSITWVMKYDPLEVSNASPNVLELRDSSSFAFFTDSLILSEYKTRNNPIPDALLGLNNTTGEVRKTNISSMFVSNTATLDFPSTSPSSNSDLTVTVTGAALGDVVSIGTPTAPIVNNSCYTAWVSAANTITIRFNNYNSNTVDPSSGTFKATVIKF